MLAELPYEMLTRMLQIYTLNDNLIFQVEKVEIEKKRRPMFKKLCYDASA